MNWHDLTPRERDVLVAEHLMGGAFETFAGRYGMLDAGGRPMEVPHYSTDATAADAMEDEIARRGLQREHIMALLLVVDSGAEYAGVNTWYVGIEDFWMLLRASPEQRCLAALRAKGVAV